MTYCNQQVWHNKLKLPTTDNIETKSMATSHNYFRAQEFTCPNEVRGIDTQNLHIFIILPVYDITSTYSVPAEGSSLMPCLLEFINMAER
jgi:hypothetical protein